MKPENKQPEVPDKPTRDNFFRLGSKVMSATKAEIDARDKQWHARKRSKKTK